MSIYTKGNTTAHNLLQGIIVSYHGDLDEAKVTVGVMMAHPSPKSPEKPPLTEFGQAVKAKVSITSLKDRVSGLSDARIEVDASFWSDLTTTDEQRSELLDTQLSRLEVKRDKEGHIVTDDHQRPVLKRRKFDYTLTGFDNIIRRHGSNSLAVKAIEELSLHANTLVPPGGVVSIPATPDDEDPDA